MLSHHRPQAFMSQSVKYQRHIDGLRAVAVLSVVLYHYGQKAFGGGFVGVDVFFVISGYLISKLILGEISSTGGFSFKRFYIRRIRRLFPALAATLLFSLIFAVALFSPQQFQSYGRSLAAAVFSVSNIQFWLESGYFDADSHLKPLLHTWSLSVEEQIYLFWPALLWLFTRNSGPRRQFLVLLALGVISFALNYYWVTEKFDANYSSTIFYLTPFRIFELVIGGMAVFSSRVLPNKQWLHEILMAVGLALITYAILGYSNEIVFPYLLALPPCIGALLVIVSHESRIFGWLLRNRLAVGVGLISYSLYLTHWPVLVFYKYYKFEALETLEYTTLFVLSVALSILMYFFVEKPFRKNAPTLNNALPQKVFVFTSIGAMALIGVIGFQIGQSDGRTWTNGNALSIEEISTAAQQRFKLVRSACNLLRLDKLRYCKRERPHQILIIGNSHEPDGYNIFTQVYGNNPNVNLITFGTLNTCQLEMNEGIPVSEVKAKHCHERVALLNDEGFVASLDGVIYSANQPFRKNKKADWQVLQHLKRFNPRISIAVLGGYINTGRDCSELYNRFESFNACRNEHYVSYNPFRERGRSEVSESAELNYLYIDKTRLLCREGTLASCAVKTGGKPAFYDMHHLSLPFARHVGRRVMAAYGEELKASGFPAVIPREFKHKRRTQPGAI